MKIGRILLALVSAAFAVFASLVLIDVVQYNSDLICEETSETSQREDSSLGPVQDTTSQGRCVDHTPDAIAGVGLGILSLTAMTGALALRPVSAQTAPPAPSVGGSPSTPGGYPSPGPGGYPPAGSDGGPRMPAGPYGGQPPAGR